DTSTGEIIFEADLTVTLAEYKRGLFYGKGYVNCGRIAKGYIGVGQEFFDELEVNDYLIEPEDAFFGLPIRSLDDHKYSAGKVLTIAGSGLLPGASFFTANSALKAGAGASILAFPNSIKSLAQNKLDGAIVQPYDDKGKEYLSSENIDELKERINWADVIAIGPGLGRETETGKAVIEILKRFVNKKFVIDADAVCALGGGKYKRVNLKEKVLTPHHKEFADLVGIKINELQNNILSVGKEFVKKTGAYLVLKGAPTIIFTPLGDVYINSSGNPGMAKFGTGDVLTGVMAGIISQNDKMEESIFTSVYLHGLTADLLLEKKTDLGITASDIMEHIPNAIKFLEDSIIQSS
ncbi:MAG: NAD(P)H-hydrate dehydratase, partial [Ignavibacteria bacterium RBG_13_36_8]